MERVLFAIGLFVGRLLAGIVGLLIELITSRGSRQTSRLVSRRRFRQEVPEAGRQ
jgi:uncharacterized membrane protein YciS (DUF1049 family)